MKWRARLPVKITKCGNLMITAKPCLLPYHHDHGVSANPCPVQGGIQRLRKGRGLVAGGETEIVDAGHSADKRVVIVEPSAVNAGQWHLPWGQADLLPSSPFPGRLGWLVGD
jgi:hypothetical protein